MYLSLPSLSPLSPPPPLPPGMRIMYTHDDTETLKDAVTLQLTDGVHTVQDRAEVSVVLVNDEEPRLIRYTHTHSHTDKDTHTRRDKHIHTHTHKLACTHTHR